MVLAHHLIWVAYGWWLPNDPRGSSSHGIASDVIAQLGELHRGRKRVQPAARDIRAFYERARQVLRHPLRTFSPSCGQRIAGTFAEVIAKQRYTCYACAIMPDHVHLVMRKHKHMAEDMIAHLQDASGAALRGADSWPADHPVWGGRGWKVFLDSTDDIWRTIAYVEDNPLKQRLPPQHWPFVTPYDNWPLHRR